jgi:hypothetical protein
MLCENTRHVLKAVERPRWQTRPTRGNESIIPLHPGFFARVSTRLASWPRALKGYVPC